MVQDVLQGNGRTNAVGEWDLRKAVDHIPKGWRGKKQGFATDLVYAIANALNEEQWQTVRYLLRAKLADVEVARESWYFDHWIGGGGTWRGNPIITSWERHRDRERLKSNDEWLWGINYWEYFEFVVTFTTLCEREKQIEISAEMGQGTRLELRLKDRRDVISAVRDNWDGERLADYAMDELEHKMENYNSSRSVWRNACRKEVRKRFEREGITLADTLKMRLRNDVDWRRDNEAIDLAAARIKSWLRVALYDPAGQDANLEALMNDTVTMRSPERAMREGETLWTATRRVSREIERFAEVLAADQVKEVLREGYGHEGVMRTLFVGIDAANSPAP